MGRWICRGAAALLGIAAGMVLFSVITVIQVDGSSMLPTIEPGTKVIVEKIGTESIAIGDVVVYEAPLYDTTGEGKFLVRRVKRMQGDCLLLGCDAQTVESVSVVVKKNKIMGKVIGNYG